MARSTSKQMKQRRREVALRAALCRSVVASRGFRHASPLVDALAKYAVVSDKLPYASQKTPCASAGRKLQPMDRSMAGSPR